MRRAAITFTLAALVCGVIICFDGPIRTGRALADNIKLDMPTEAFGFDGVLLGKVAKETDPNGCFDIRVTKVVSFSAANKTKLNLGDLTTVWKDKADWCRPEKPVNKCEPLKVGDTVVLVGRVFEVHIRYTKVTRQADDAGAAPAQPRPATAPGQVSAQLVAKTYTYKTVGDLKIQADVYQPDSAQPRPVLVWLHGGALMMGNRKGIPQDLRDLCRAEGYCLVSPDYRLAPQAKLPQIIEDLRDFMKWVNEKGPELFGAQAGNVVVAGGSAGGYLTMMAGIMQPKPKALVAYYGYGDVDGPWYVTPSEHYRKQPLVTKEDAYKGMTPDVVTEPAAGGLNRARLYLHFRQNGLWTKEVSGFDPATEKNKLDPYCPVRNVTAGYPPIVMIHGTADTDVPCQESLDMAEALKKCGARYELFTIPGAGHGLGGGDQQLVAKDMARAREFIKENLSHLALEFSDKHVKNSASTQPADRKTDR